MEIVMWEAPWQICTEETVSLPTTCDLELNAAPNTRRKRSCPNDEAHTNRGDDDGVPHSARHCDNRDLHLQTLVSSRWHQSDGCISRILRRLCSQGYFPG